MKNFMKMFGIGSMGIIAIGCANTPDLAVSYFLAKSELQLEVIRTVTCNAADNLIVATTVKPTVSHMADTGASKTIEIAKLDSLLSHSDLKFEFYEDGRLKGVNTTSTGQGETIIKSAISLAVGVAATASVLQNGNKKNGESNGEAWLEKIKEACNYINGNPCKRTKTMTLKFEGSFSAEPKNCETEFCIKPTAETEIHLETLGAVLGKINVTIKPLTPDVRVKRGSSTDDDVLLTLRQPANVTVEVSMGQKGAPGTEDSWSGNFAMAQYGTEYEIPVPKAAFFGKQTFNLAVAPSGAMTKIGYTKAPGVAQAIGVGQNVLDTFGPTSADAAQIAKLKAEATLIAAQQRLVRCRADPTTCK